MRRVALALVLVASICTAVSAQTIRSLTPDSRGSVGFAAIDDNGGTVVATLSTNPVGANPKHSMQLFSLSFPGGAVSQKTLLQDGAAFAVSVSDDGTKTAFVSPSDPLGTNADGSLEAFLWDETTQSLTQLTSDSSAGAGSILDVVISGSGARVVVLCTTDPLGSNPSNLPNLFSMNADGSNVVQVTPNEAGVDYRYLSLSDNGALVAYVRDESGINDSLFVGQTASMSRFEVGVGRITHAQLSGNGLIVVYERSSQIETVPRNGGAATVLGAGQSPSITDDAAWVVFTRAGSVWEIETATLVETQLTGNSPLVSESDCRVSGNHTHILCKLSGDDGSGTNPDGSREIGLFEYGGSGAVEQVSDGLNLRWNSEPDADGDGSLITYASNAELGPGLLGQGRRVLALDRETDQLTELASTGWSPTTDDLGTTVAFVSTFDPLAQNGGGTSQLFTVAADGSALTQRTQATALLIQPVMSGDGSFVVFASNDDFVGQNGDGSGELFRLNLSDDTIVQLTQLDSDSVPNLRLSADGQWVVFQSASNVDGMNPSGLWQIFRAATDGSGATRITGPQSTVSSSPTTSGDGNLTVFSSAANFVGTNADGNRELFLWNQTTMTMSQLTTTTIDTSGMKPTITEDGEHLFFYSRSPYFEDRVDQPKELYRMRIATQTIERVSGLYDSLSPYASADTGENNPSLTVDSAGRLYVASDGNRDGSNVDRDTEIWEIDLNAAHRIDPSKATPTSLSWGATPQATSYDVIRTQRSALVDQGGSVDLGAVVCLVDDRRDLTSGAVTDAVAPTAGQVFFYLVRSNPGSLVPSVGWGSGDAGPRTAGAGDCPG